MEKYKNFHICRLVIGVQRDYPAFWLPYGYMKHGFCEESLKLQLLTLSFDF